MCGIVGVAGNTYASHMKAFRDMLIFDQVRGLDSTGVVAINGKDELKAEKEIDGPDNLWNYASSKIFNAKGVPEMVYKALIGHNRAATVGKVVVDNAHPFTFGDVTGVHNGSLMYWNELEKDENGKDFDVDSKALLKTIAEKGIEHAWKSFIGAASLVWWDAKDNTLNFARNKERPMYLGWSKNKDVLFYASEPWMIEVAAARNNIQLREFKDEESDKTFTTYETATNHHFKFEVKVNSIKLVEDKELPNRPAYTAPIRAGTTIYPTNTKVSPKAINFGWAKNLTKAGKELVGKVFTFSHPLYSTGSYSSDTNMALIGHLGSEKTRVEVYPTNSQEFWRMFDDNRAIKRSYKILARPRIVTNSQGAFSGYAIGVRDIEEIDVINLDDNRKPIEEQLYPTIGNRLVDEDTWRSNLRILGGCCDMCGTGISLVEAESCEWLPQSVICPSCVADGTYNYYYK